MHAIGDFFENNLVKSLSNHLNFKRKLVSLLKVIIFNEFF